MPVGERAAEVMFENDMTEEDGSVEEDIGADVIVIVLSIEDEGSTELEDELSGTEEEDDSAEEELDSEIVDEDSNTADEEEDDLAEEELDSEPVDEDLDTADEDITALVEEDFNTADEDTALVEEDFNTADEDLTALVEVKAPGPVLVRGTGITGETITTGALVTGAGAGPPGMMTGIVTTATICPNNISFLIKGEILGKVEGKQGNIPSVTKTSTVASAVPSSSSPSSPSSCLGCATTL